MGKNANNTTNSTDYSLWKRVASRFLNFLGKKLPPYSRRQAMGVVIDILVASFVGIVVGVLMDGSLITIILLYVLAAIMAEFIVVFRVRWHIHLGLIVTCLIIGLPILYALTTASHTQGEIFSYPPKLMPGDQLSDNVKTVLDDFELTRFMLNSTFIALAVTLGKTILSLLAGMAFVYFDFPMKGPLFFFVLITLMMPTHILIVALFQLVSDLELGNTYWALTMPFLASATGTFLFRQHFSNIPAELAEAARIDGAGPLRFLWRVLIPLSWNTIGALAVIQFVYMWNQYLWPLIIINENERQVVQVGIRMLISGQDATDWGPVMAGAVIATIPPLLVFMLLQRQFLKGFAFSTEK